MTRWLVFCCTKVAAAARATKKTDMNEVSSRSHSIFTLHLAAYNERLNAAINGQLNLCDLAGSERVERSGATGQSLTEAKNINKSLSALAHVFESLSQRAAHVPFRDSTLTYLLEPTLSGNGKTLMIVNLSPTQESVNESVSTLRFGAKVTPLPPSHTHTTRTQLLILLPGTFCCQLKNYAGCRREVARCELGCAVLMPRFIILQRR